MLESGFRLDQLRRYALNYHLIFNDDQNFLILPILNPFSSHTYKSVVKYLEFMKMSIRPIKQSSQARPTMEGAGIHLHRVFGFGDTESSDPFLMMDDFRNDCPTKYINGFPWHPHRGIETITYVLKGNVEHSDSLGNHGVLSDGDVQWMTAGSGIIHQEMPTGNAQGQMHGFQLWANLPRNQKCVHHVTRI